MTRHWLHIAERAVGRHGALQDPRELGILLAVMDTELPYSVLEIGTWKGGLTWAFGQLPGVGQIVTVDHNPRIGTVPMVWDHPVQLDIVQGDSQDPATAKRCEAVTYPRPFDVAFIDGDHRYAQVSSDWELYEHLVRPGGMVVLHDIEGTDEGYEIGVPKLWAELREHYACTEIVTYPGVKYGTGIVWV